MISALHHAGLFSSSLVLIERVGFFFEAVLFSGSVLMRKQSINFFLNNQEYTYNVQVLRRVASALYAWSICLFVLIF